MLNALVPSLGWVMPCAILAGAAALALYSRALASPFRLAAKAGALALAGWALFQFGALQARGTCATASLKVALASAQADLEAARHINSQTRQRMAQADSLAALNQDKIDALAENLARRPTGACLIDDADARRLRDIGGPAQP